MDAVRIRGDVDEIFKILDRYVAAEDVSNSIYLKLISIFKDKGDPAWVVSRLLEWGLDSQEVISFSYHAGRIDPRNVGSIGAPLFFASTVIYYHCIKRVIVLNEVALSSLEEEICSLFEGVDSADAAERINMLLTIFIGRRVANLAALSFETKKPIRDFSDFTSYIDERLNQKRDEIRAVEETSLEAINASSERIAERVKFFEANINELLSGVSAQVDVQQNLIKTNLETLKNQGISSGVASLTAAFVKLREIKEKEKLFWLRLVTLVFLLMISIAVMGGYNTYPLTESSSLLKLVPYATAEIIAGFFLRVFVIHFNSVQAQLIQIHLKIASSDFIQSFVDFKEQKSGVDIGKFEALIFSGIAANLDSTPGVFDAFKEVVDLIKADKK